MFAQSAAYDTTQNRLFTVVKSPFQVDKNGAFSWIERTNTYFHHDTFYARTNGVRSSLTWDQEGVLKATGQIVDTKTRTLKVTVERWPGSGRYMDRSGGGTITVSADGYTQTYFPGTHFRQLGRTKLHTRLSCGSLSRFALNGKTWAQISNVKS